MISMPSKMIGARVPDETYEAVEAVAHEYNCSVADLVRHYVIQGLQEDPEGIVDPETFKAPQWLSPLVEKLLSIERRLTVITKSLNLAEEEREDSSTVAAMRYHGDIPVKSPGSKGFTEWFSTTEAWEKARKKGLNISLRTFRRRLKNALLTQVLPPDLARIGLEMNELVYRKNHPALKGVRWIRFINT